MLVSLKLDQPGSKFTFTCTQTLLGQREPGLGPGTLQSAHSLLNQGELGAQPSQPLEKGGPAHQTNNYCPCLMWAHTDHLLARKGFRSQMPLRQRQVEQTTVVSLLPGHPPSRRPPPLPAPTCCLSSDFHHPLTLTS